MGRQYRQLLFMIEAFQTPAEKRQAINRKLITGSGDDMLGYELGGCPVRTPDLQDRATLSRLCPNHAMIEI
jgi:hypothetical protein